MTEFEVFGRQRATPSVPYVTVHSRGVISLNAASLQALGMPDAVELLYDRDSYRMGLRSGDPNAAHTYGLRGVGDGTSRTLSGTAFFQYYDIPYGEPKRFRAEVDGKMLVVDLSAAEPLPPMARPPRKNTRPKHYPRT